MTPNPILKVLSTLTSHRVRHLLMGGQACVLYGAAEFSRDTDVVVLTDAENLERLAQALNELQASVIAVPPYSEEYLRRGHAVHFRCSHPEALGMRIDVMAVMRGVAPFAELWPRRTTFEMGDGMSIDLLSLPDLVQAKKTQRDKDWPMIRRLVEAHYAQHQARPTVQQVLFWLRESRTPMTLIELAQRYPDQLAAIIADRPLLSLAVGTALGTGSSGRKTHARLLAKAESGLSGALEEEAKRERDADRAYWRPLRAELEELRRRRRKKE